ncbi:hypothetical protein BIFGAL_04427 [Bifidobacterium gallicum DSM 20093 = LMG 11596]|uniref:Uncharacterized protein n=1 Tax=Bifidobacterium gallicum DSM 20093 = LMG 11596 TaxID=561180 RepID=D1NX19_9BIFI|nr:hypothetical protein BIFGAL_04427 [Bifidobacterium gallicum DSM 20093 = LMG 11596]
MSFSLILIDFCARNHCRCSSLVRNVCNPCYAAGAHPIPHTAATPYDVNL